MKEAVASYADTRGLIICETYLDAGVSGGTLERPALQCLLADCRAGKIGTVITQDLERLSRNPLSLIAVLESFLEDGVNVEFSTKEGGVLLVLPRPLLKYAWQALLVEQPTLPELGLQYCFSSCA